MNHTHKIVRTTNGDSLGKAYIDAYHSYIQWNLRPSRQIYWDLFENGLLVGSFGFGSGLPFGESVAQYMESCGCEFNELVNNIVYCLNGHQDKNAGTKFLKMCRIDALHWWYEKYGDILKCYQTFIEPPRTGAMYKADNWEYLGMTKGHKWTQVAVPTKEAEAMTEEERKAKHIQLFKTRIIGGKDEYQTTYVIRQFSESTPKLIFMKSVSEKERRRVLQQHEPHRFF